MIFHIVSKADWQDAVRRGSYEPRSLRDEGFVHCSTLDQTVGTANRFFRGRTDLLLLRIDPSRLNAEVRYEFPADPHDERAGEAFPHIYGPLNLDAVTCAVDFSCDDGAFRLPAGL